MLKNILFYTYASGFFVFNGHLSPSTHTTKSIIDHKIILKESLYTLPITVEETVLPLTDNVVFSELLSITSSNEHLKNISYNINLNDTVFTKYEKYFSFLKQLIQEINKQSLMINLDDLSIIHTKPNSNLNGKDNQLYNLFENLFREKLDYINDAGPLKGYTMLYNLIAHCFVERVDENNQLVIKIIPIPRYKIKTILADISIVLVFTQPNHTIKDKKFKFEKAIVTLPHLLKGTALHKTIKTQYSEYYKYRNLLKTQLLFQSDNN